MSGLFGRIFWGAVVVLLSGFAYQNALNGPFLVDDLSSVLPTKIEPFSYAEFWKAITADVSGVLGRLIPLATFSLNFHFGGDSAYSFKVFNLLLHLVNTVLVYHFLVYVFRSLSEQQEKSDHDEVRLLAFVCSALWCLHPLQLSTVMYVVQRMTMLSTMFTLIALVIASKYLSSLRRKKDLVLTLFGVGVCLMLALACKENGILIIVYVALLYVFLTDGFFEKTPRKYVLNFCLTVLIVGASGMYFLQQSGTLSFALREFDMGDRLLTQPGVLLFYLQMILAPDLDKMSLYHDAYPAVNSLSIGVIAEILAILLLLGVAWMCFHKMKIISLGILIFFTSHLLESTILPLELVFEHRNYLALLGVVVVTVFAVHRGLKRLGARPIAFNIAIVLVTCSLATQTYSRSLEWQSRKSIISVALKNQPESIRAKTGWLDYLGSQGQFREMRDFMVNSAAYHPDRSHLLVQATLYTGYLQEIDEVLFNRALRNLKEHPIRTADIVALRDIADARDSLTNGWPGESEIDQLFQAATLNRALLLRESVVSQMYAFYFDFLVSVKQLERALEQIEKRMALDGDNPEIFLRYHDVKAMIAIEQQKKSGETDLVSSDD